MRKKPLIISLFFLAVACLILISQIQPAQADGRYNWIKNPSFSKGKINIIEDGGFESGELNSGVEYGNWTAGSIYTNKPHSGAYSCYYSHSTIATYELAEDYRVLGSEIDFLEFYYLVSITTYTQKVSVTYTDGTSECIAQWDESESNVWKYKRINGTSFNQQKRIWKIKFSTVYGCSGYIDDVILYWDTGTAQDDITPYTSPWYCGGKPPFDYIGFNTVIGHTGSDSLYFGYTDRFLYQDIDYLPTNTIAFVDLYYYATETTEITVTLVYSDRTYSSRTKTIHDTGGEWEYLNFGASWIEPNKYVIQIQITIPDYIPFYVNIDDVGLWSSINTDYKRFSWYLTPQPIRQTSYYADVYQGVKYTLNCEVRNSTNGLSENGTYTISTQMETLRGNVVNGVFSAQLSPRQGTTDFMEQIVIRIDLENETILVELTFNWKYTGAPPQQTEQGMAQIVGMIIPFAFLFIPTLILGHELGKYGFMIGLVLGCFCLWMVGLFPIWAVFLVGLGIVLMLLRSREHE